MMFYHFSEVHLNELFPPDVTIDLFEILSPLIYMLFESGFEIYDEHFTKEEKEEETRLQVNNNNPVKVTPV